MLANQKNQFLSKSVVVMVTTQSKSANYDQTASDIIYKVRLWDQDVFVIIITEFQSTVDRFMVLRVLNYITNFYMDYVYSLRKSKKAKTLFKFSSSLFPRIRVQKIELSSNKISQQ